MAVEPKLDRYKANRKGIEEGVVLEIRLLGHPQFLADGVPIKLPKRSVTIPLAAYLLLHRDEAVSRSFLAFTLWANDSEETALAELRRYIYLLNKTLPRAPDDAPWIRADDDVVRWDGAASMRLDVAEFERLSAAPSGYAEAVKLYAGDLLEDAYDDWLLPHRERLRALYFADLVGLIAEHRGARDFKRAAAYATQLLSADPWREDVVRLLMACRYESGDAAGALAAFDAFAKRLRSELGVEPMPETLVARDAIVRSAPLPTTLAAVPSSAAPQTEARGAESVLPFVGRDAELEQLRAAWVRAARGNGGLVFVCGQAGIGKSRLVAELARSVEAEGGRVSHGTTTPSERFPYEGIVEALRYSLPFVASLDLDALRFAIIAQLLPELTGWRDDQSPVPPIDPSREQPRLLDAVASCIAAMARPRPLLIVLEDLHWAGADTAAAIAFLARRLARSAVLIVGTYREEEVGRTHPLRAIHQALRGEQLVQTIALRPLSESAVELIVERLAVPPDDRARIARLGFDRSEGNPLFLTEALRDALRPERGDADVWTGSDALRNLIASRVASLSDDARDIARIAAVVGHGFQVDLLRDVAGIEESKVLDGLYELLDHNLVREAGARRRFDFAFTHHLIHKAIYEDIEPAVRTRRHRRIAQIIGERPTGATGFTPADLALHRELGGDRSGAAISYVDAARHATALFANDDAIKHATKSIELSDDDAVRAQALLVREQAFGRAARKDRQEQDIEALRELSVRLNDDDLAWEASTLTVAFTRSQGDREKQDAAVAELERRASASGIPRRRAEALLARADLLVLRTSHADAERPASEALDQYEQLGDIRGQVAALAILAEVATVAGDFDRSRRYLLSLRKRSAGQPDQTVLLRAIAAATMTALQRRQIDDASELARDGLALSRAIGDRDEEANALQRVATVKIWQDDFDGARRAFADSADVLQAIGNLRGLSHAVANQMVLAMRLGLLDEAEHLGDRVFALTERTGERRPLVVAQVNMSLIKLLRGDVTAAKRLALEALDGAREIKFPLFEGAALSNLGNAERADGDVEAGLKHLLEGLRLREAVLDATDILDDRCDLSLAYLQAGRLKEATAAADLLLKAADVSTAGAFWPQYCYWAAAQVRRATGAAAEAKALLDRAVAVKNEFAEKIADAQTRAAFLALPINLELSAAAERDEWPLHAGGAAVGYTPPRRSAKRRARARRGE